MPTKNRREALSTLKSGDFFEYWGTLYRVLYHEEYFGAEFAVCFNEETKEREAFDLSLSFVIPRPDVVISKRLEKRPDAYKNCNEHCEYAFIASRPKLGTREYCGNCSRPCWSYNCALDGVVRHGSEECDHMERRRLHFRIRSSEAHYPNLSPGGDKDREIKS